MPEPQGEAFTEGAAPDGEAAILEWTGGGRLGVILGTAPLPRLKLLAVGLAFGSMAFPAIGLLFVGGLDSWRDLFPGPGAIWVYAPAFAAMFLAVTRKTRAGLMTVLPSALAVMPTILLLFAETVAITHGREAGRFLRLAPVPSLLIQGALLVWLGPWAARRWPEGCSTR